MYSHSKTPFFRDVIIIYYNITTHGADVQHDPMRYRRKSTVMEGVAGVMKKN